MKNGNKQRSPVGGTGCGHPVSGLQRMPDDVRVRRVLHLFRQRLDRPFRVAEAADCISLSRSRLAHLFRRETDSSPARMLKRMRMLTARQMLLETDLRVKEVAARVGLNDVSHFVRDFESTFGLSPARYRKMAQSGSHFGSFESPATGEIIPDPENKM